MRFEAELSHSQYIHFKQTPQKELWCFCQCQKSREMVSCDKEQCEVRQSSGKIVSTNNVGSDELNVSMPDNKMR